MSKNLLIPFHSCIIYVSTTYITKVIKFFLKTAFYIFVYNDVIENRKVVEVIYVVELVNIFLWMYHLRFYNIKQKLFRF